MAEFNLYPRFDADESGPDEARWFLDSYTDREAVSLASDDADPPSDPDVVTLNEFLEVGDVDVFAELYMELKSEPEVYDVSLWGPTAERFPVLVEHYALQQISAPDLYEFYALDSQVTMVICESEAQAQQLRRDVPPPALG
jgi:hypothetical protein